MSLDTLESPHQFNSCAELVLGGVTAAAQMEPTAEEYEAARRLSARAIGRKGVRKDYHEEYLAVALKRGATRAARAPAPDTCERLPAWLANRGKPLRPRSAPATRPVHRRVRDRPTYLGTGVLYSPADGGAVRPSVAHMASVASTEAPGDSVAPWPKRWKDRTLPLRWGTTPPARRALQKMLNDKQAKHGRDKKNRQSKKVTQPPLPMAAALRISLDRHREKHYQKEWKRWVHKDCRFFGRPGSGLFKETPHPRPFGTTQVLSTPLRLETAAAARSDYEFIWRKRGGSAVWKRRGGEADASAAAFASSAAPVVAFALEAASAPAAARTPAAAPAPAPSPAPAPARALSAAPVPAAAVPLPAAAGSPRRRRREHRDPVVEHIDYREQKLIESTGIQFGAPGDPAEESLASERALRHEPPNVRRAAARQMAKLLAKRPTSRAERRSQTTVLFDAAAEDVRRQRRNNYGL